MRSVQPLTVIKGPLQNGGRAGPAISDAGEGQDLNLVQHVLPQPGQLHAVTGVALHRPEPQVRVQVLLLIGHLGEGEGADVVFRDPHRDTVSGSAQQKGHAGYAGKWMIVTYNMKLKVPQ